jgi:hypothetical protein
MPKKEISLLSEENVVKTLTDKTVKWILSVGKYIVIFTNLVVIGAFLSRFWLDRQNTDLSEKIRQQKAILSSVQNFEKEFRLFQSRLTKIKDEFNSEYGPADPLLIIAESLPADLLLSDFKFTENNGKIQVNLKAQIFSEVGLANFIDNLLSQPEISSVQVRTIEKEEGKGGMTIQFLVKFNYLVDKNEQENTEKPV